MIIDYLVPEMYTSFDIEEKRASGGGMMPNINARATALASRYKVNVVGSIEELTADFCLVESLWFTKPWIPELDINEATALYAKKLDDFYATKSTKVLVCSEMEIARIPWWSRAKFDHYFSGIVVNCRYLYNIVRAFGMTPIGYLNDCIDPYLFKPGKKELSVIAVGGLKHIKNPYLIFDVFRKLKGTGMKRVYIGSAEIWSNEHRHEDFVLPKQIRECTDVWIPNASYAETAHHVSSAAIGINDTWHDCSSRSNQEMLMAGVVSVGGRHPIFEERPGIHGLETADEFVEAIENLTDNFNDIPVEKGMESREWALKNLSTDVFLQQFDEIIRGVYL